MIRLNIGLNILENARIYLGQNINDVEKMLKNNNISYSIYKSSVDNNIEDGNIIVYIESYGVEINTHNNIITYIKSGNSKLNYIMNIHIGNPAATLAEIRSKLAVGFDVPIEKIKVVRFQAYNYSSIMVIPYNETTKIRVALILGVNNGIFIENMGIENNNTV